MSLKIKERLGEITKKAVIFALAPVGFILTRFIVGRLSTSREIADNLLISSGWTIIKPPTPLKINRRFQRISLSLEDCRHNVSTNEENLLFSDGTIINPPKDITVEILDEDGTEYRLESGGYGVNDFDSSTETFAVRSMSFKKKANDLPKNKSYVEVRIRSNKPFHCPRVSWINYNLK
jgi:hypothetical protein